MARASSRATSAIKTAIAVGSALGLLGAAPALVAHHSAAIFDDTKVIELTGTVREFQWTNPHSYLQLVVKDAQGQEQEWSLEMAAPTYLYNLGWRPATLKAGDVVSVTIAPLRKGGNGGLLLKAATADGKPIGRSAGAAP